MNILIDYQEATDKSDVVQDTRNVLVDCQEATDKDKCDFLNLKSPF